MYQLAISRELNEVFSEAEKISNSMNDKFITEEHLFMSLINKSDSKTIDILKTFWVNYNNTKETIEKMDKNGETIEDNDGENKLNALKKYWIDLVELAKKWKNRPSNLKRRRNQKSYSNIIKKI